MLSKKVVDGIILYNLTGKSSDQIDQNHYVTTNSICDDKFSEETLNDLVILGWVLAILTLISNSVVVVCTVHLLKKGEEPRCTYMLLGNIAVSDVLTALILMVDLSSLRLDYTDENKITCIFMAGTNTAITLVSVYSVLLISIDRFLYIIHGIRYNQLVLPHKVGLMISVVWALGLSFGIAPLFFYNEPPNKQKCWYPSIAKESLLIAEAVLGMIPIVYVIMLYSIILYKAIKNIIIIRKMTPKVPHYNDNMKVEFCKGKMKIKQTTIDDGNTISVVSKRSYMLQIYTVKLNENGEEEGKDKIEETNRRIRRSTPKKSKAIKVVLFTAGCFTFTWFPYFILSIIFATTGKQDTDQCISYSLRLSSYVGALNSFFNPIIYAWWHNRFRKSVKKLYCRKKKEITIVSRSSSNS